MYSMNCAGVVVRVGAGDAADLGLSRTRTEEVVEKEVIGDA